MAAFPAYPNIRKRIRRYPLAADQTFPSGAPVMLNGDGDVVVSDKSTILGFALHPAGALPEITNVLVALALPGSTFVLQGDRDPLQSDEGDALGLETDADGDWIVDTGTTDMVRCEKVYTFAGRNQFEVSVLEGIRQLESE